MNKLILVIVLDLILANISLARSIITCPNLQGNYICNGTAKDFDGETTILQKEVRGATEYILPYFSNMTPQQLKFYKKRADGVLRTTWAEIPHSSGKIPATMLTQCISNSAIIDTVQIKALNTQFLTRISLSTDPKTSKKLMVVEQINNAKLMGRSDCYSVN